MLCSPLKWNCAASSPRLIREAAQAGDVSRPSGAPSFVLSHEPFFVTRVVLSGILFAMSPERSVTAPIYVTMFPPSNCRDLPS